ncbi:PASTA domain-containing protein [Nocardiopsis sp. NPDC055551]
MTPDPHTGLTLRGRVLIGDRLRGDGTVSEYSGTDADRPVTVTLLAPEVAADPANMQAFLGRARSLARVDAPGLARILEEGVDGDLVYTVTEHLPGQTIAQVLEGGERGLRYAPHAALTIVTGVLTALNEAHDQGVVHGGLGPRSVVLDGEGRVTVTGFRMLGIEGVTPRTDVHAVGSLLHTLLTGSHRFDDDTVPSPSSLVPGLAPELDELVADATEPNPRNRPRDAGQYLAMVEQVARSLPGPAGDTGPGTEPIPVVEAQAEPTAKHPVPLWRRAPFLAIAAVLALVLVAAGWALVPDDTAELPDLLGYTTEMAEVELEALELGLAYSYDETYSDDAQPGEVAATDPAAGTELGEGDTVLLSLSIGARYVEVPDVVGGTESEARDLLRDSGFDEIEVVREHSADHDPGTVLSTIPEVGEDGDREEGITLHVSEGVIVPTLTDMTRDEASAALESLELTTTVVETSSETVTEGWVAAQNPEPGTVLPEDGEVTLTVSTGPEEVEEPEGTEDEAAGSDPEEGADTEEPEAPAECSAQAWDSGATYDSGDRVQYEGRVYEARRWTMAIPPNVGGEWGAWSDQGPC